MPIDSSPAAAHAARKPRRPPWLLPPLLLLLSAALLGRAQAAPLRNPDGSCLMFPAASTWHADVSRWPLYSGSRCGPQPPHGRGYRPRRDPGRALQLPGMPRSSRWRRCRLIFAAHWRLP